MSFYLLSNVADSKRTSKGLFKDGESMAPLEAIATANSLLLDIFHPQKQLSQRLQRHHWKPLQQCTGVG
jgi:hypothetical protein